MPYRTLYRSCLCCNIEGLRAREKGLNIQGLRSIAHIFLFMNFYEPETLKTPVTKFFLDRLASSIEWYAQVDVVRYWTLIDVEKA